MSSHTIHNAGNDKMNIGLIKHYCKMQEKLPAAKACQRDDVLEQQLKHH